MKVSRPALLPQGGLRAPGLGRGRLPLATIGAYYEQTLALLRRRNCCHVCQACFSALFVDRGMGVDYDQLDTARISLARLGTAPLLEALIHCTACLRSRW
ncbi:MAG: hypothetical protein WKG07_39175 [Hymenobacter sp.]